MLVQGLGTNRAQVAHQADTFLICVLCLFVVVVVVAVTVVVVGSPRSFFGKFVQCCVCSYAFGKCGISQNWVHGLGSVDQNISVDTAAIKVPGIHPKCGP